MNELWLVLGNRPCNQRAPEKNGLPFTLNGRAFGVTRNYTVKRPTNSRARKCYLEPRNERAAHENEQCKADDRPMLKSRLGPAVKSCKQRGKKHQGEGSVECTPKCRASRPVHARRVEQ